MLFKPDPNQTAKAGRRRRRPRCFARAPPHRLDYDHAVDFRRPRLHRLDLIAAKAGRQPDRASRSAGAGAGGDAAIKDVPVYLDGVGAVRALNTVTVRSQVDGKLIAVNFVEGQDVKKGDVLAEIDPVIYKAQYDQAVAKKAQDEAQLANQRLDLVRYQQLAASNAGSKQQYDTQKAVVAQQEALVNADQAAIDNAPATLGYTKIIAPLSGRTGLRQVDQGNIIHAADVTGSSSSPSCSRSRCSSACRSSRSCGSMPPPPRVSWRSMCSAMTADGGRYRHAERHRQPGRSDHRHAETEGRISQRQFPAMARAFVNVRLKVDTLSKATVVPTSAVQRGPAGTFSYVIGDGDIVTAKPVVVTQQNETEAVIASGVTRPIAW